MNTSIAALKRSKSNLDNLVSELNKVAEPQKQKQSYSDDRFWKPELDKSGNGYAVLRILPLRVISYHVLSHLHCVAMREQRPRWRPIL